MEENGVTQSQQCLPSSADFTDLIFIDPTLNYLPISSISLCQQEHLVCLGVFFSPKRNESYLDMCG